MRRRKNETWSDTRDSDQVSFLAPKATKFQNNRHLLNPQKCFKSHFIFFKIASFLSYNILHGCSGLTRRADVM